MREAKIQDEDIQRINVLIIGQWDNPAWNLGSKGHLTGSVLKAQTVTPSLLKRLFGEYDLSRIKAIQWGVINEEVAILGLHIENWKKVNMFYYNST